MKNGLRVGIVAALLAVAPVAVFAKDSGTASTSLKDRLEQRLVKFEEHVASSTARQQKRLTRSQELQQEVLGKVQATYNNLVDIEGRVETHLASLKANGVDTTAAEAKLADAKDKLAQAKSLIDKFGTLTLNGKTLGTDVSTMRKAANDIKKDLNEAKVDLVQAVRGAVRGGNATSTREQENEGTSTENR